MDIPPSFKDGIAAVFDVINRESGYIDKYGNLISIKKEDLDSFPFDDIDTLDNDCFINEDITSRIYKVGCSWEYIQDPQEIQSKFWDESEEFDKIAYVDLPNGRPTAQVCVLQQGKKYGIYTAYHTIGMGGPGTWCNPMVVSFPYDEVKYFTSIKDGIDEYGLFAFRINEKWGIIKVVDGRNEDMGVYDVEFPLTKRRIVVPCEYFSLADAEFQLRKKIEWKDPFEQETELF